MNGTTGDIIKYSLIVMMALVIPYVLTKALVYWIRKSKGLDRQRGPTEVCGKCGYEMKGLDIPRCPECGSVVGFEKTFEELGVDEEEVREHLKTKQREVES